jgi:hypothetical protein
MIVQQAGFAEGAPALPSLNWQTTATWTQTLGREVPLQMDVEGASIWEGSTTSGNRSKEQLCGYE